MDNRDLGEKVVDDIQKNFVAVGKHRVHSWYAWAIVGIVLGMALGIVYVANRSGTFNRSSAGDGPIVVGGTGQSKPGETESPSWWPTGHEQAHSGTWPDDPADHGTERSARWPANHDENKSDTWIGDPDPDHPDDPPPAHKIDVSKGWPPMHTKQVSKGWPAEHLPVNSFKWPGDHSYKESSATWPKDHQDSISSTWPPDHSESRSARWPAGHEFVFSKDWNNGGKKAHNTNFSVGWPPNHVPSSSQAMDGTLNGGEEPKMPGDEVFYPPTNEDAGTNVR